MNSENSVIYLRQDLSVIGAKTTFIDLLGLKFLHRALQGHYFSFNFYRTVSLNWHVGT